MVSLEYGNMLTVYWRVEIICLKNTCVNVVHQDLSTKKQQQLYNT